MKKSIFLISACLLSLSGYAQTFSGGEGTEASPYLISNAADLTELATVVNGGNTLAGKYIKMTADITVSGDAPMIGYTGTAAPKKFAGSFDGGNHTIKGLDFGSKVYYVGLFASVTADGVIKNVTLDGATATSTNSYGGLLAGSCDGTIQNCHIVNGSFTSTNGSYKGGLLGQNKGVVRDCSVTGTVTSSSNAGGVVGQNYGGVEYCWSSATIVGTTPNNVSNVYGGITGITINLSSTPYIRDCYYTGNIQGALGNNIGGITGTLSKAPMDRCWTTAYIASNGGAGGLCYNLEKGSTINDCYFAGTIYCITTYDLGGLLGHAASDADMYVKNCLNYGTIFSAPVARGENMELCGGGLAFANLNNCFFDAQISGVCTKERGISTSQLTSGTAIDGFDTNIWEFTSGLYPRLKSFADKEMAQLYAVPIFLAEKDKATHVTSDFTLGKYKDIEWEINGSGAKQNGFTVTVTRAAKKSDVVLTAYFGNSERRALLSIYPVIFEEKGTVEDPYLISSADDMMLLSDATNVQELDFTDEYFRMTNDIDMSGKAFIPFSFNSTALAFNGTFDGGGYAIKNLQLDSRTNQVMNVGLFRTLNNAGVVKNLKIDASCKFDIYRNYGTIACVNYGTIDNCRNYADIPTSEGYSGGLVYQSYGKILNSFNGGNMSASTKNGAMGGICYNNEGIITNCQNSGDISAMNNATTSVNVAGIAVTNKGEVTNVLNTGRIASGGTVAGLIADNKSGAKLTNALNLGQVSAFLSRDYLNATVAKDAGGEFTNVFYDTQIGLYGSTLKGITGYETAILTAGVLPISDQAWKATAGRYPLLTSFAEEPQSQVASIPVYFQSGMRCDQLTANGTLTEATGLTWTVTGEAFAIEGKTLKVTNSDKFQTGVLTATYGGASHSYDLAALAILFEGKGTKENPYLIKSAADVIKLSEDIASSGLQYAETYFSITSDLDFAGAEYTPVAGNGSTEFKGILKGGNHTVKNMKIAGTVDGTGFVGRLGAGGVISDLTFDKTCSISSTKASVGAVAGMSAGTIDNCVNYASVTSTITTSNVGGIVGLVTGYGVVSNCTNYANITPSKSQVGGIIGYVNATGATVKNIANYGNITGTTKTGGCVGYNNNGEIDGAVNYGKVTGTTDVAGIAAYCNNAWSVTNVKNFGEVNGATDVAGIIAYAYTDKTLSNSMNAGTITGTAATVGGLVGYAKKVIISNSFNVGDVTNSKTSLGTSTCGAGGLVAAGDPIITDAYNVGTVKAERNFGGIVGKYYVASYGLVLTNVYQAGKVVSTLAAPANMGVISGNHTKFTFNNVYFDTQVNSGMTHANATEIKSSALAALDLGDNWINVADALPILKTFADNDYARLYSATVLLDDNDHHGSVSNVFTASTAHGVSWKANDDAFKVDGSKVSPAAGISGDHTLTATLGDVTRTLTLTLTGSYSGVEEAIATEDGEVIYYDLNGRRIYGTPTPGIYVEKRGNITRKVIL